MFDFSKQISKFHQDHVRLSNAQRSDMKRRRTTNHDRIVAGLGELRKPGIVDTIKQGGYRQKTMVQPPEADTDSRYDIDMGLVFDEADVVGPRSTKNWVKEALTLKATSLKYPVEAHLAQLYQFADRWLGAIRTIGKGVLDRFPIDFYHVARPRWPFEDRFAVTIRTGLSTFRDGAVERVISSGDVVPQARWLRFEAHCPTGLPDTFQVWWRVVNTGGYAARRSGLRGDFYPSEQRNVRWEQTQYLGVHWVEAFVVNGRTDACIGRSDRFFVVIE